MLTYALLITAGIVIGFALAIGLFLFASETMKFPPRPPIGRSEPSE